MVLEEELGMPYLIFATLGLVGSILILLIVATIIFFVKRNKKLKLSKGVKINSNGYEDLELLEIFGVDNIVSVECEMSRVTVEVKDIDIVDTTRLQEKGASGVLLVGNKVKCNFKENSEIISNYLKGSINND